MTERLGVPQVSYATAAHGLTEEQYYPQYLSVFPNALDYAHLVPEYIHRDVWRRGYLSVLYDQTPFGEQFDHPLENTAHGNFTITSHLIEGDNEAIENSLDLIKLRGYKTIILITDRPPLLEEVSRLADKRGLLEDDFFWLIIGDAVPPALLATWRYEKNSPMDKLLRGSAVFTDYDPFIYKGEADRFLQAWRSQNSTLVQRLNEIQPRDENGEKFYTASDSYFQDIDPSEYSSYMYDAIMATGIGACRALQGTGKHKGEHLPSILEEDFHGASGRVTFGHEKSASVNWNGRDVAGLYFGVSNVRPGPIGSDNKRG